MPKTKIEWAEHSWNPIAARNRTTHKRGWYCEHTTPGCEACYSEAINRRFGTKIDYERQNRDQVELFLDEHMLAEPLSWPTPRRVFVCSMTDLFAEFVSDAWIDRIFVVMARTPQHTFQVLTKRADRMREYISGAPLRWPDVPWPLANVWLGVSVEDQRRADERIPVLLETAAALRWVSCEPLLERVDVQRYLRRLVVGDVPRGLDWIVAGGETGPGARSMRPQWARLLRDQCRAGSLPFFLKHRGEWLDADEVADRAGVLRPLNYTAAEAVAAGRPIEFHSDGTTLIHVGRKAAGRMLDGRLWEEYPDAAS
jgi:protein gp37